MAESYKTDGRPSMQFYHWNSFLLDDNDKCCIPKNISFPGTYVISSKGECLYIGQSKNLYKRLKNHIQISRYTHHWKTPWGLFSILKISIKRERKNFERLMTEKRLIVRLSPSYNNLLKENE